MNRIVVLGVAIFFALVGIALVGGENKASAFGHRCHCSCNGCNGGCNGGGCCSSSCHSRCHGCHRSHGCHSRCHGCHRSHRCHGCCSSSCNGGCCGGYEMKEAAPVQAPAEKQAPVQAK